MASEEDNNEVFIPKESPTAMTVRQAEELKDLRSRLERIRCSIPRKDRAGRSRAVEEAAERESELGARHAVERKELGIVEDESSVHIAETSGPSEAADATAATENTTAQQNGAMKESKAARRRRKKKEQEAEAERRVEAEKAQMGPTPRFIESQEIETQLSPKQLRIHPVAADGHCLYSAVAHQMKIAKLDSKFPASVEGLRNATADYLIDHKAEYMPFIETVEGDEEKYQKYCKTLRNEAVWGGQIEVKVMAEILGAAVEIYAAGMPLIRMGEDDKSEKVLRLSYHRHYFGLGEHYNSVVPKP